MDSRLRGNDKGIGGSDKGIGGSDIGGFGKGEAEFEEKLRGDGAEGLAPDLAVFGKSDKQVDLCACDANE